jgi:hypothetical protein
MPVGPGPEDEYSMESFTYICRGLQADYDTVSTLARSVTDLQL